MSCLAGTQNKKKQTKKLRGHGYAMTPKWILFHHIGFKEVVVAGRDVVLNKLVVVPQLLLLLSEGAVVNYLTLLVDVFRSRIKTVSPILLGTQRVGRQLMVEPSKHCLVRSDTGVSLLGCHRNEVVRADVVR